LHTLKPNIELFKANNAKWVFEQHSNAPSELFELRAYLTAKLLWNPAVDVDAIMTDFLNGYYGEAAPFVQKYIETVHESLQKDSTFFLFLYGDPSQGFNSFLSKDLLSYYDSLYNEGDKLLVDKEPLRQRLNTARLSIDYALLEYAKRDLKAALKNTAGLSVEKRLARFQASTQAANITAMNEMRYSVADYIDLYKNTIARAKEKNIAYLKPVRLLTKPKKYANEDPQTLTDGAFGSSSFYANWLGFEGNNMEAVIDLEAVTEVKKIATAFLQVTNHIVFLPEKVSYWASLDGKQYKRIATINNPKPLHKKSRINDIQYFNYQGLSQKVRYLKIIAESKKVAPVWHHAAGLPSWIFVDEVTVE
jgi:hypothetical protein